MNKSINLALTMVLWGLLAVAHGEVVSRFTANGVFGQVNQCAGGTCMTVSVTRGNTNGMPQTFLYYSSITIGPTSYTTVFGSGLIPNSDLAGQGTATLRLHTNTALVSGFSSNRCTLDFITFAFTCQNVPGASLDVEWKQDRASTFRTNTQSFQTIGNLSIRNRGRAESASASVSGTVDGFVITGGSAQIGVNHSTNMVIERQSGSSSLTLKDMDKDSFEAVGRVTPKPRPRPQALYTFTTLDIPGAERTRLFSINDRGDIAGSYLPPGDSQHGFVLSGGVLTTIDPPGSAFTQARGINASGQVVGLYVDQNDVEHGFILTGGKYTTVDYPNALATDLLGIDNVGRAVGVQVDPLGNTRGFLYQNGSFTPIDCPGVANTVPIGINASGQVVGNCDSSAPGGFSAFVYANSTFTFTDVPNAVSSAFFGINAPGQAVGSFTDVDGIEHGMLASGGTLLTLDDPAAQSFTRPRSINASGTIVGFSDFGLHGFIAVPKP